MGVQLPLEASRATDTSREGLADTEPTAESSFGALEHTLSVRSSVGLPLPFIEWETTETEWRRQDLVHSRCQAASMKLPCRIRAPGHGASLASQVGQEIVLEPDALLVIEASGLKDCASAIRPYDSFVTEAEEESSMRPELRRAIAWGWISEDRWAIAALSDLVEEAEGRGQPVRTILRWRDGRTAWIDFDAKAASRESWTAPCSQAMESAPLEVTVVRPSGSGSGRLGLRLKSEVEGQSEGQKETYGWGNVILVSRENFWQNRFFPSGSQVARFDDVPMGEPLLLGARDEETSAYGRLAFVHDGSARELVLRSPFELTGRLVSDATAAPVATADLWWQFKEGEEDVWGWHGQALSLALAPDGGFHLRGPSEPPDGESSPLDPPTKLLVHVAAPGFRPFERRYDTSGASSFDCGEIRLTPVDAEMVLARDVGLAPKAIRWQRVMISSMPGVWWNVQDAAPTSGGRLAVFFVRSEEHPDLLRAWERGHVSDRAWPSIPPQRILIHVLLDGDDEPRAFERGSDGNYMAAPRSEHEIELECRALPTQDEGWMIGIQWHEIWDIVGSVSARRLGQRVHLRITTPVEGASLFWSADGHPPSPEKDRRESSLLGEGRQQGTGKSFGGSVPIDALTGTLVLH